MDNTTYTYKPTPSPADYPHAELNATYSANRAAYTEPLLVKTRKPRKKKVKAKEVEALKDRAESIEGSEVVETIINTGGELPIMDRDMVNLFNGS